MKKLKHKQLRNFVEDNRASKSSNLTLRATQLTNILYLPVNLDSLVPEFSSQLPKHKSFATLSGSCKLTKLIR